MALLNCPECGKSVSSMAKTCPDCGFPITDSQVVETPINDTESEKIKEVTSENKVKQILEKKWLKPCVLVLVVLLIMTFFSPLNKNEQMAYECAKELKEMMKDPDSFQLYDEMYLVEYTSDKGAEYNKTVLVFKYGGSNSYGANITDRAIFMNGEYIMDYDEISDMDESDWNYEEKFNAYWVLQMHEYGEDGFKKININANKIKKKMGLK